MEHKNYDVVIVGGGMAGMVMALCLKRAGLHTLILEQSQADDLTQKHYDGRNTALNAASVVMFENLDLWQDCLSFAQPINDIIVSDGTVRGGASSLFLHFDSDYIGDKPMGYFIQNPDLRHVLIEKITQYPEYITIKYSQKILDIVQNDSENKISVHTNDEKYTAKILIAADGKKSLVRTLLNIPITEKSYGQSGIVTTITHEYDHQGVAQEYFMPSGPFAMLPLMGNQTSLVWTEQTLIADALLKQPKDVLLYEIRRRFGDSLGKIDQVGCVLSYPLSAHYAHNFYKNRCVLIADSAHGIHPISGQGFNLGLRDIGVLYDLILSYQHSGLDIGGDAILSEYEKKRQFDIHALRYITDGLNLIFSNDNKLMTLSRRLGLKIVDNIPVVRDYFIKHASGQMGNLPQLMR